MSLRFITKRIHAYLDYPVAVSLIGLPIALGLGQASNNEMAFWFSIATGVAAFLLTILTDHHLGLVRVLPYNFHLAVDGVVGVAFVAIPLIFNFTGLDFWYYTVLGTTVLFVVSLHKSENDLQTA